MSKFLPISAYQPDEARYQLLPFNFARLGDDDYVLTNLIGEHAFLSREQLQQLVDHRLAPSDGSFADLRAKHFIRIGNERAPLDLLALKFRSKNRHFQDFTSLHIFVVTLRCEHSCPYCQVSRQSEDTQSFDMTVEMADRALDIVFRSPSPAIKIEFQGGEPLLNFPMIQYIVERAEHLNVAYGRDLQFVIATNLAVVTAEMLQYCRDHSILISTSLDGPADLHNKNRPRSGKDSYERAVRGIELARGILGVDRVSAVMTTTEASLSRVREIVDQYVRLKFDGIFLRSLSPYGFAIKTKTYSRYRIDRWLAFYREGLDYIIELNKAGVSFVEQTAAIILTKMLTPQDPGYVDLMSPAGIGIAAIVFNYDGDVYASDESRMLAEMGDRRFLLGNVLRNRYEDILLAEPLLSALDESFALSAPMCSECAFEPYCGADPVFHHATQNDVVGRKPSSEFCRRNTGIFEYLLQRMRADEEVGRIFRRWANRC